MALPGFLGIRDVDDRVAGPCGGRDVDRAVELAVTSGPDATAADGEQQPEQYRKHEAGWTKRALRQFAPLPRGFTASGDAPPAAPRPPPDGPPYRVTEYGKRLACGGGA